MLNLFGYVFITTISSCFIIIHAWCAGIGQSKKLARRHAAENMLATMAGRGININPSSKRRVSEKLTPELNLDD